jgi:UDP-N-acetylmuramate--alanine ligase
MFLGLHPIVAAITHLEHDHPDCFPSFAEMFAAFEQFIDQVPSDGLIVGCADQPAVARLLRRPSTATVQTCGLGSAHDWCASESKPNALGGHDFKVSRRGEAWGRVRLRIPGLHNVQNALVAVVVADWLGVDPQVVSRALITFSGVERRFQIRGQAEGITVVDDYGHHPTEIRATLDAARIRYGDRPLWAVFQPHTFSRMKALWGDFAESFGRADHTIVLDVYGAREPDSADISAAAFVSEMAHPDVHHIPDVNAAARYIVAHVEPDAVIITLSAGDGNLVGMRVLEDLAA